MSVINYSWFILLPTVGQPLFGQSSIHGNVSIQNSLTTNGKREYVSNAEVSGLFGNTQKTGTDIYGNFHLIFKNTNSGETVSFQVEKKGYEVVNVAALTAIAGQKDAIKIAMAKPEYVAAYRTKIYHVGKSAAEQELSKKLENLKSQLAQAKKTHRSDSTEITKLITQNEEYWTKIETQSQELAKNYAIINLDDASPIFRDAFSLFQGGYLDSALLILTKVNLANQVAQILQTRKKIQDLTIALNKTSADLVEALLFKAELHKTKFQVDSVLNSYRLALLLDPTNTKVNFYAGFYYKLLNENDSSIYYYQQGLKSTKIPMVRSAILGNLGVIYETKNRLDDAERCFNGSITIDSELYLASQGQLWKHLAEELINLGRYYIEVNAFDSATSCLQRAHSLDSLSSSPESSATSALSANIEYHLGLLYEKKGDELHSRFYFRHAAEQSKSLTQQNVSDSRIVLANALSHLGAFGLESNDNPSNTLMELNESLTIYESLSGQGTLIFGAERARIYYLIGKYYAQHLQFPIARKYSEQSTKLYDLLIRKDHESFGEQYGQMIREYGNLLTQSGQPVFGIKYLSLAYDLFKKLADSFPKQYQFEYAETLIDVSDALHISDNPQLYDTAEVFTLEALNILRKMDSLNHQSSLSIEVRAYLSLGHTYNMKRDFHKSEQAYAKARVSLNGGIGLSERTYLVNLGSIFNYLGDNSFDEEKYAASEVYYDSAIAIYRKLNTNGHDEFEYLLGSYLNSIGICLAREKKYEESEKAYKEANIIWMDLISINRSMYEPELAQTLMNLGGLYHYQDEFSKSEVELLKALQIIREYKNHPNHLYDKSYMMILLDLAASYDEDKKPALGERYLFEALQIYPYAADLVTARNRSAILQALGHHYLDLKQYDQSRSYYHKSLQLYELFPSGDKGSINSKNYLVEKIRQIDSLINH